MEESMNTAFVRIDNLQAMRGFGDTCPRAGIA